MPNSTLASLTAATAATGGLFYGTQAGADRKFTLSPVGAALCEATTAAGQRTALGIAGLSTGVTGLEWSSTDPGGAILTIHSFYGDIPFRTGGGAEFFCSHPMGVVGGADFYIYNDSAALRFGTGLDTILRRGGAAATLQLGNNDATTPTTQTIKGMDVTTGVGGRIGIRGGSGSVNGGDVALMVDINGSGAVDALLISGVDASAVFSGNLTGNSIINAVSGFMINGAIGASGSATAANTLTIIGGIITNIA
jgi:hypothetical protein